ncbi:1-acyl-sn-glycerol-3-phosphate acyltransferase alpha-like [Uranotaenia lowii]|uniref:1-acyl-sn-glycerol-3-phosphate acyltransferase alpha-like n=1 Tax=Uranotaenia lowii TaxID=190385 RepID=UPI002479216C|nr:1-acyl-sn-glycerol-3-phosphate acyltransferase alpha-like [Uranotaenia lowii]
MASYFEIFLICGIILLPICYETSQKFRYRFKFFVYYAVVLINSLFVIPAMMFRPKDVRNLIWAGTVCRPISAVLGLKWELRGADILSRDEAYIIVANHQSSLDILGMFDFWHVMNKCTVIAKKELLYTGPFGLASWLCGLIFIDRKNAERAHASMNDCTDMLKEKRIKLWVFPEGTRRNTNEIHPFKKGAFHVAVRAQIPIMPVVYSSYGSFLDDKAKILNNGHVIVTTLEPIETKGLTCDDIPDLMDRVRNVMIETFKATTKEVENKYSVNGNSANNGLNVSKSRLRCIDDLIKPKLPQTINNSSNNVKSATTADGQEIHRRKE